MPVILYGSPFSTFTWSARLALVEKGVEYTIQGVDLRSEQYGTMHPWRRMPVMDHDGFRVFEAAAVMRYVDEAFFGPALQPPEPAQRARMTQWLTSRTRPCPLARRREGRLRCPRARSPGLQ